MNDETQNQIRRLMAERDLLLSAIAPADYDKIKDKLDSDPGCGPASKSVAAKAYYRHDARAAQPVGTAKPESEKGPRLDR